MFVDSISLTSFLQTLLTALWCSKSTRLIIASHQQKVSRLSSGQQILPKSFCKSHCWFKFNQFRQPLWKTLALLPFPISPGLFHSLAAVASPHVYILYIHTHARGATPHALKKRERAGATAASALLSLSLPLSASPLL